MEEVESRLESKVTISRIRSPIHPYISVAHSSLWTDLCYQSTQQKGRVVVDGLGSTSIFVPTGQEISHAKRIPCCLPFGPILNSGERTDCPS